MSARKRRAVGGDARSQSAPAGLESVQHSWSIHPHGRGMLATMTQGRDAAAGAHEVGGYNAAISAASYISIFESSSTVALDVRSQALPPSQVLALRLVECARMPAQQLCIVTASDTKKEIVISTLQSCDDDAAASLPLLPLLSLSLSNPSSLCCSISDGPTVVLWRKPNTTAGSECVCVQWTGQHWTMHDASLPRDSETTCCFAHSLGPSSDAATFVLSDSTGGATCIIPSLLNTSSPPRTVRFFSHTSPRLCSSPCLALLCDARNDGASHAPQCDCWQQRKCRSVASLVSGFRLQIHVLAASWLSIFVCHIHNTHCTPRPHLHSFTYPNSLHFHPTAHISLTDQLVLQRRQFSSSSFSC